MFRAPEAEESRVPQRGGAVQVARYSAMIFRVFLFLVCVGRPIAEEYAAGYDLVANKVQLEAMRAVRQCSDRKPVEVLGSAALFSKEELTMGTADYEVDENGRKEKPNCKR